MSQRLDPSSHTYLLSAHQGAHHLAREVGGIVGNGTLTLCWGFCHYIFTCHNSQLQVTALFSAFLTSRLFTDSDFDI